MILLLAAEGIVVPVLNIGLEDRFIEHGTREECLQEAGLDVAGIESRLARFCERIDLHHFPRAGSAQVHA